MKKKLSTPLEEGEIKGLKLGDIVYFTGEVYTARDKAHRRIIEYELAKSKNRKKVVVMESKGLDDYLLSNSSLTV